ncbi:decaprenyl-phosphate phosphoribosyltransferase [Acetivibrio saccincola]|jgi:4-hydroxybenzoate polyprenyltransferase|uniref:decaprenyl-phosphate phosphoribosyltransferase n=1 Tax=Acetivibrio saccincola TaxID=1677857 RepID=UPI000A83BF58|nr:decaprenyl-phosphate phosphoribosyltransferase [Acetivibrio saccincola]NLW25972.1 decaprenyl-phosphate phosphoribosyltransferase [Acetivibrio saccincola]HOA96357.1 decaprenyl-phosphate phosphoribosyltransferase [Acetivibrio saccincola]HQD28655.1 decaprenyl-phosphate phosphoribosyltransferase [Acetivibrio saccincola]
MIKSQKISFFAKLKGFLELARPKQWIKNLFVFAALVFAGHAFDEDYLQKTTLAFLLFCLISACVYILNDIVDVNKDRAHPKKRTRPIASGIITPKEAVVFLIILLPFSLAASFKVDFFLGIVILVYFLNNLLYSLVIKHWVILDVMSIALGFLLRVIGGALVIKVYISPWILLCTLLLSLFLGFSKRRNELTVLQEDADSHRKILKEYSLEFIDNMLSIVTASTVMAYSLYTFSSNSENYYMMATIPFVLYGIFRYQYIIYQKQEGGSPEETVLSDVPLMINILLWVVTSIIILYFI